MNALIVAILTVVEHAPQLYAAATRLAEERGELTPEQRILNDARAAELFAATNWQVKEKP
jgi:hypothetical protein